MMKQSLPKCGKTMVIDLAWFTARHACSDQVAQLRATFGDAPIQITSATLRWAGQQNLDLEWWASRWLSGPLLAKFERQVSSPWAESQRQVAEVLIGLLCPQMRTRPKRR